MLVHSFLSQEGELYKLKHFISGIMENLQLEKKAISVLPNNKQNDFGGLNIRI